MQQEALAQILSASAIGAALAVMTGLFTAIGQGNIGAKAVESIARQPEARGAVQTTMFISVGLAETTGIYGLFVAMILLFANPLVTRFVELVGG